MPTQVFNQLSISTASGTPPLAVNQTALVTNLNADLLDGQHGSYYQNANNLNAGTIPAAQMPAHTGDVTSTAGTIALTLANSGVTAGTYTKVTVDAKGRVTTGALLASADLPTYTGTITSSQVTSALGFTPYNATNPSGYITNTATITGYSGGISVSDSRAVVTTPQSINMGVVFDFKQNTTDGLSDGGTYFGEMTFRQYGSTTDWSGGLSHQLGFTDNGNIWQRSGSSTTWGAWKKLLDTTNFSSHALPLTGGTLSGALMSSSKIETLGVITGSSFVGLGTGLTGTAAGLTAGAVPWTGVTGKPTTLAGYGITDALDTSGTAQTKSGNLTVNSALTSGGAFYAATTVQYSNRQPIYTIYYGGGQDLAWKKVADITIGTGLYRGVTFKVDVVDNQGNFGFNSNCFTLTYFATCIRSGGVQDDFNNAVVTGPVADYVRVVKTATGVYELQIRQLADWQTYIFTVEATINSGGNTVTYASSSPSNGSTTGTIYAATAGWTSKLANIAVAGGGSFGGAGSFGGQITSTVATGTAPLVINSTTAVANLNADLLDGQHGSYFEGRDTTAVGFSAGTLTLTRTTGNLTANLDGRYLPLTGGTLTGALTGTSLTLSSLATLVNSAGTSYNENIRLPRASSGYVSVALACDTSGSGSIAGQFNLVVYPAATSGGAFALRANGTDALTMTTAGAVNIPTLSGTTGSFSGQITSTVATGTAPFSIASTTRVDNLNVQYLNGQLGTYYAAATSLASYLPLSGGTMTGGLGLHSTGTNGFYNGTGDAATYALYNFKLGGWNGMALENLSTGGTYPSQVVGVIDFRNGTIDMKGGFKVSGASVITENQSITISGDASGSGKTAINLTLANVATAGTYRSVTINAKGLVTAGTNPTTLAGYGITDALPLTGGTLTGNLTAPRFISNQATGTAPFGVTSTTVVANLNADLLDGQEGAYYQNAGNLNVGTLLAARLPAFTGGDVTSTAGTVALTLANSGVTAGTYTKVTVDAKGRVTTGASLASADLPTYTGAITSSQVTTGLGYTPAYGTAAYQSKSLDTVSTPGLYQYDGAFSGTKPPDNSPNYRTIEIGTTNRFSQIAMPWDSDGFYFRRHDGSAFSAWRTVIHDGNFTAAIPNSGVTAGTYRSVTVDVKGRVTAGTNPTTLAGYGITDAMYQVDPNGFTQGDIYGSGNMQRLWGTDSVQNLIAFRPPTTVEYTTDNVNWVTTTISNDVFDGKVFGKWAGFSMNVGSNIGAWTKVRMTWVNFGYHFFSHFTLCHSTNGHSMNFVFYKSDLNGVFSSEAYRVNGINSWPGYTFTSHVNVSGHWDTRDIRMVFELNGNNGPSGYPNNAISIGHIGIMGGYSSFNRVYDWDGSRNITLFGNLTLPGNVTAPRFISNVATGTAPFGVTSTTAVTNLNADLLDGQHGSYYQNASNLNAGTVPAAQMPAHTGDVTSTAGSVALTLANSGVTAGTYNNVTVNAKGLVTGGSNVSYLTGNQSITLSGDLTGSGTTSIVATIAGDSITNAKLKTMGATTIKGNNTGVANAPADLTPAQVATMLSGQAMNIAGSSTSCPWSGITGKPTTVSGFGITDTIPSLAAVAEGDLNTATATGFRRVDKTGFSSTLLTINVSGSSGPVQIDANYTGVLRWRNQTDSTTWTAWKTLLHDANYGGYSTFTGTVTGTNFSGPGTGLTGTASSLTAGAVAWTGVTGKPTTVSGFGITDIVSSNSGSPVAADTTTKNGFYYVNSNISLFSQTDGALFVQAYDGTWASQIYQDYRTGQLAIRGRNSGTWQAWRTVLDSTNFLTSAPNSGVTAGTYNNVTVNTKGIVTGGSNVSYITGNQTITLSGDVTGSGTTAITATIPNSTITNAKLNTMGAATIKGNNGGVANSPSDLSVAQVATMLSGQAMNINGSSASCTGNAATATSSPLLSALGNYVWSASTLPTGYNQGIQASFVQGSNGFQSYGSVVTVNTYSGGGGALQMYVPYSPTYGGNGMQVRFGNYDVSSGNSWTAWKTILASDNYNSYSPTLTGGGASGSWSINAATATNSTQLNGQAASYYENRDTTAVGISAGTLTLTRAAGNLTTTIGGRIVAWCEFNGTFATTGSPNAGFNVSSLTKNATGDYTVNFTSALANVNYAVAGYTQLDTPSPGDSRYNTILAVPRRSGAKATGSCRIVAEYPGNNTLYDCVSVGVAFIAA